jgi:hypothetical protein
VAVFFVSAFLLQCLFAALLIVGLRRARSQDPLLSVEDAGASSTDPPLPPVSVVVAVHNEVDTVGPLLDALAAQTHPEMEVVLVDDASTDGTRAVLEEWAAGGPSRRVVAQDGPAAPSKKAAVDRGIAEARHPLVALTDADCRPPNDWCRLLAWAHARSGRPTVWIGYSPFRRGPGLLNRWSRYETWQTGALTAAAAMMGRPYMAVGRNLSTPVDVFDAAREATRGDELLSGDDDLFVQAVRRSGSTDLRPLVHPDTFVPTGAPATWRSWLRQKRRHVSAGRAYDPVAAGLLTAYHGSHLLLWLAPLALGSLGAGLLAARLLIHASVAGETSRTFGEDDLLPFFPIGELMLAFYHAAVVPVSLLLPPGTWRR